MQRAFSGIGICGKPGAYSPFGIEFGTDGRALLSTLPVNAQLRLTGQSSLPGFVDVVYGQKLYGIFMVDLKSRSATIRSKAVAA